MKISELKSAVPPIDFFRRELGFIPNEREDGWTSGGLCPFHPDKRRGNFRINVKTGSFKCFACGAAGGDIINFVQLKHNLTCHEAINMIKNSWCLP